MNLWAKTKVHEKMELNTSEECVAILDGLLAVEMRPEEHELLHSCREMVVAESGDVAFGFREILAMGQLALAYPEHGTSITAVMMYISGMIDYVGDDSECLKQDWGTILGDALTTAFRDEDTLASAFQEQ